MLSELEVFEENYALLSNTVTDINDPLIKCFVEDRLFNNEEEKQITGVTVAQEKLRILLQKISHSLKAHDTKGFQIMLRIMKECGGKGTQTLADHIINRLKISNKEISQSCARNMQVEDDKFKGIIMYVFILYVRTYSV